MNGADQLSPLYIAEAEVVALIDMGDAIESLQRVLELEADGKAQNMIKTHVGWGDGSILHALGSTVPEEGFAGTKTWTYTKLGGNPVLVMFDSGTGRLRAVIEAAALGALRTGAISGVATHWLSAPDADSFAIIGSGKQALTQAAAVAAVRTCRSVRVFSPNQAHREAFCATLADQVGLTAQPVSTLEAAVDGARIVTLITRSQSPFLRADMLADGTHVNAAGAIVPAYVEFFGDVLRRSRTVSADSVPSVRKLSRELMDYYGDDEAAWSAVVPISQVAAKRRNQHPGDGLTLFKSVGMGLSDMALGIRVYREALARGAGVRLDPFKPAAPNYRSRVLKI